MIPLDEVKSLIERGIEGAVAEVNDMTGTSDHYEAVVVSAAFEGRSLIQRHKMVYDALGEAMSGPIHALKLKTMTPQQANN